MADDDPRDAEAPAGGEGGLPMGEESRENGDGRHADEGSAPLDDLAERIRSRRGEPAAEAEGFGLDAYFEEESFEAVESDKLWASLEQEPTYDDGVEAGEGPDEHVVPKRQYCETCEHFSTPPEVHCDHPGTTIVEFADINHVLVRSCPIVAERRALGDDDMGPMTQMSFGSGE